MNKNTILTRRFNNGIEKSRIVSYKPIPQEPVKERSAIRDDNQLTKEELEERKRKKLYAARKKTSDAIMTFVARYFMTFTSPIMDTNPTVLLEEVVKYLKSHGAGKAFAILEPFCFVDESDVKRWHVHVLSENPVDMEDWIYEEYIEQELFLNDKWKDSNESVDLKPENLYDCYCEGLRDLESSMFYLTKKLYITKELLPKGTHVYKTVGYKTVSLKNMYEEKSDEEFMKLKEEERKKKAEILSKVNKEGKK